MKPRKRRNTDSEEIDITSLLDILVILLVFLLKNFNSSDLTVDLVSELSLPYSFSQGITNLGVVLQINKFKEVYINNEFMGNFEGSADTEKTVRERLKKEYKKSQARAKNAKSQIINLVLDKTLKYQFIDQILQLSNETGFSSYKLIVQGKDE